jgi:uncharacterized membrane protein
MNMARTKITLEKALPYILMICGLIGIYCAFVLTQDKLRVLENPNTHLSCSIDPIISCGNVIQSKQGTAFGFPNPYLGLAGFAALVTIGLALKAGATFKRWFWLLIEGGMLFAVGFVHWLFFETVYSIGALCIYCIAVWVITITSFWYVTMYNHDRGFIRLPKQLQPAHRWVRRHHLDILLLWFLILGGLILKHFWYYYGTKI